MKNTSTQKLISASFALFTAMMPLLGAPAPAEAAFRRSCKDVYLKVQNNTGEEIKVIDLDYWDPSSGRNGIWRSEPVSNEVIPDGQPWQEVRNLEKVDQMNTRIRVQYRTRTENGNWSWSVEEQSSSSALCDRNSSYTITLN